MGRQRTGDEHITFDNMPIGYSLSDYWAWNSSDLLNNTLRGSFCEFIVSAALGLDLSGVNSDWDPYDVSFPYRWQRNGVWRDEVRIEVKSCSYLQAWEQSKLSNIMFSIRPTRAWDPINGYSGEIKRQSDVYVFCVYTVTNREKADPLVLDGWEFYVLPTETLNNICGPQKSISLPSLRKLDPIRADYSGITDAIIQSIQVYPPVVLHNYCISVLCIITEQPRTDGAALPFLYLVFFWRSEHGETG